jgi:hypothetical protein
MSRFEFSICWRDSTNGQSPISVQSVAKFPGPLPKRCNRSNVESILRFRWNNPRRQRTPNERLESGSERRQNILSFSPINAHSYWDARALNGRSAEERMRNNALESTTKVWLFHASCVSRAFESCGVPNPVESIRHGLVWPHVLRYCQLPLVGEVTKAPNERIWIDGLHCPIEWEVIHRMHRSYLSQPPLTRLDSEFCPKRTIKTSVRIKRSSLRESPVMGGCLIANHSLQIT